jgi:hypothetical protein
MPEKKPEEEPIVVVDRRRFTDAGERRPGVESSAPPAPDPSPAPVARPAASVAAPVENQSARQARQAYEKQSGGRPKLDFETLVRSLAGSAMLQLGLVEDPVHGRIPPDLEAARDTIDMLGVLEEKTRGNRAPHEEQLLGQLLYELRTAYVALTSGPRGASKRGA